MKIGLFYSYGPHFLQSAKFLREQYSEDELLIFVPQSFPKDCLKDITDKIVFLPWDGQHLNFRSAISTFPKILQIIRKTKLDYFVILFESPRLIFLSQLSKAKHRFIFTIHNEYKTLTTSLISILLKSIQ
ncbi:MAG TPA: hypothetical protein PK813_11230, partial [Candidatus Hydrogenedens sp.]|nr:hypothetical protein [Candidatus Hydrogenedens sp.]